MKKVFISYAAEDVVRVKREIIDLLRHHGIDVWFAANDIAIATHFDQSILKGLEECDWFLVALSPHAIKSEWVRDEVHWAIENRMGRIVPVLLDRCSPADLHLRLQRIQFVDFCELNDDARRLLLRSWGVDYRPKPVPSASNSRYHVQQGIDGGDLEEFVAEDLALKRRVLIKRSDVLLRNEGLNFDPVVREACATRQLQHRSIPRVFDLYHDSQFGVCSVLEHVRGGLLRSALQRGVPIAPSDSVRIVVEICDAVHYANDRGVVHRNIKPESIVVDDAGLPHLTNFCIAQLLGQSHQCIAEEHCQRHERRDLPIGTPSYMAPEQWLDPEKTDRRVDVWGLGVLTYEMLTGRLPFDRGALSESMAATLRKQPTGPRKHNRSIPRPLETICLGALEKDPNKRFSTAAEFASALRQWGEEGRRFWQR